MVTAVWTARHRLARAGWIGLLACALACILMTQSRITLAAAIFCLGLYAVLASIWVFDPVRAWRAAGPRVRARCLALSLTPVVLGGVFIFMDGHFADRIARLLDSGQFLGMRGHSYAAAMAIWLDTPYTVLFGNGIGAFQKQGALVFPPAAQHLEFWHHVHNETLEILVEGGIAALGAYLFVILSTLMRLFRCVRNQSLSLRARLTALGLAVSLATFECHGLFSISTRTLAGHYTFALLVGLAWAHCIASGQPAHGVVLARPLFISALRLVWVGMLVGAGWHLHGHVEAKSLLGQVAQAREARHWADVERLCHRVLMVEPDNIEAHYFLAHLYLVHRIPEGFRDRVRRIEAILPGYRTIRYFEGLMALDMNDDELAENRFRFFDACIRKDDPLTCFWLAMVYRRTGRADLCLAHLKRFLKNRFSLKYRFFFHTGDSIRTAAEEGSRCYVFVPNRILQEMIPAIPVRGDPAVSYRDVCRHLADHFRSGPFSLWAGLYGDALEGRPSRFLLGEYRKELERNKRIFRHTGHRSGLGEILSLYERMLACAPAHDVPGLRQEMLPYYLKGLRFKHYAHWKNRLAEKKG